MEEEFLDGSSGLVIASDIIGGLFFSIVIGICIGIGVTRYRENNPPTATTNPPLPPTQGGKRRTRRSRPRRGTRRV
jgi:hypothetical protein